VKRFMETHEFKLLFLSLHLAPLSSSVSSKKLSAAFRSTCSAGSADPLRSCPCAQYCDCMLWGTASSKHMEPGKRRAEAAAKLNLEIKQIGAGTHTTTNKATIWYLRIQMIIMKKQAQSETTLTRVGLHVNPASKRTSTLTRHKSDLRILWGYQTLRPVEVPKQARQGVRFRHPQEWVPSCCAASDASSNQTLSE